MWLTARGRRWPQEVRRPRHARRDAPGTLNHVSLRGIEWGRIVADEQERAAVLARLGTVTMATDTVCDAWAWPHCIRRPEVQRGSRRAPVVAVRGRLAQHLVAQLGLSLAATARLLGVSTSGIAKPLARGGV